MPAPTVITDLSPLVASNTPGGGESPFPDLDNYICGIEAIVRRSQAISATTLVAAGSMVIGTVADGDFIDVSGNTTITAFDNIAAGIVRVLRFTGAPLLTHNATSLILPTGGNIQIVANDIAAFRSLGSGNWICEAYTGSNVAYLSRANTFTGANVFSGDNTYSGMNNLYSTDASGTYGTRGLKIQNNSAASPGPLGWQYAPSIGYHWVSKNAGQLAMESGGDFVLRNNVYAGGKTIAGELANLYLRNIHTTNLVQNGVSTIPIVAAVTFTTSGSISYSKNVSTVTDGGVVLGTYRRIVVTLSGIAMSAANRAVGSFIGLGNLGVPVVCGSVSNSGTATVSFDVLYTNGSSPAFNDIAGTIVISDIGL